MKAFTQTSALLCSLLVVLAIPAPVKAAPPDKSHEAFFALLKAGSKNPAIAKTKTVGAPTGIQFSETQATGGVLVGFDFWTSNYNNALVVNGICPVYETAQGRVRGKVRGYRVGNHVTVEARPGFAVSGIRAKAGDRMDRVQVEFMRINYPTRDLDPGTQYHSDWVGGKGGKAEHHLTGNGKLVIGIFGASGDELDRFGLLYLDLK